MSELMPSRQAISGERNVWHGEPATHDRHVDNASRLTI
jgi:hypothetical protein